MEISGHFRTPVDLLGSIVESLGVQPILLQTKIQNVATEALQQNNEFAAVAQPAKEVFAERTVDAITTNKAALLHAYLEARGQIPRENHLGLLLYDLLNHNALAEEHQTLYRPIVCDLGTGNVALGLAAEESVFTFAQEILQQNEVIGQAIKTLAATPASPTQNQQVLAKVAAHQAQTVSTQQLNQALVLALTAITSFSIAVKNIRKENDKQQQATSVTRQQEKENLSPDRNKVVQHSESKKTEKKAVVTTQVDPKAEKKRAALQEKQLQKERDEKRANRKNEQENEMAAYQQKISEIQKASLEQL